MSATPTAGQPEDRHHGQEQHDGRLRELSEAECWAHLGQHGVGRLAYVEHDAPVIVPLNYLARDGKIWLRTASYNQMAVHLPGQQAAFEIDQIEPRGHTGWSVLVRGRAEHALDTRSTVSWPGPAPWPDGTRTMMFCLTPSQVTGRALKQGDVAPEPGHGPGSIQRSSG
ncbi:MAG: pyridoxamine 5'-phosphate oxidase family protein [Nocardioides sp.]|nr:pyridoxamine 5'-phosphate oxidase family protein [Nocardioides sp.]